jgi:CRISPR-associated protein Csb1
MKQISTSTIDAWANDKGGPVALTMKQTLRSVEDDEDDGGVVFPPTYADIGYNIDTLSDGTKVVTLDSVGSQANRMEPLFKSGTYAELVPQIKIELQDRGDGKGKFVEERSLLDLAHRSADAVVYATPELSKLVAEAYKALHQGNAVPLCCLAPTSLVFGAWDSRGGSGEKRPRLVRSIIRAWDVDPLYAAAQFGSIWKQLDEVQREELKKEAKARKKNLSVVGFADAPATFRKVSKGAARVMPDFRDGSPNPDRRVLGGVRVNGHIERIVTINLVALRSIQGVRELPDEAKQMRSYLLGLTLLAASHDSENYLREGCNLRVVEADDKWNEVPRRGEPIPVKLPSAQELLDYTKRAAEPFEKKWPEKLIYKFDVKAAKQLLSKIEDSDDQTEAAS